MRAIIVGVNGQDGSILWDQLEALNFTLLGVAREGVRTRGWEWNRRVSITDKLQVREAVAHFQPDHIYFLAANQHSSQDPASRGADIWSASWGTNVEAFKGFLDAAQYACSLTRIFYAASSRVFGAVEGAIQNEQAPLKPICLYGITKAAAMMLARFYRETHGISVSCGILYNHESPRRRPDFLSQKIVHGLVRIKNRVDDRLVVGSLDARVDWGCAADYTRAMRLILESDEPGDFVIATGETHSVREMLDIAAECLEIDWQEVVIEDGSVLQRTPLALCGDPALLKRITGWAPTVSFRELITTMVRAAEQRAASISAHEHAGTTAIA